MLGLPILIESRKPRATMGTRSLSRRLYSIYILVFVWSSFDGSISNGFVIPLPTQGRTLSTSLTSTVRKETNIRSSNRKGTKGTKWDRRRNKNGKTPSKIRRSPQPSGPRPIVTDYDANRNQRVNQDRLSSQAINCSHFGSCPGCVVNDNVGMVDIVQSAKSFFSSTSVRRKRLDVARSGEDWVTEEDDDGFYRLVVPSDVTKWRTQAKLAVSPKSSSWSKDGCSFGLYERGTHNVISIPNCEVHHPSINRAIEALRKATSQVGTPAFTKDGWEGGLRYVQCQVERTTGKVCLTLVWHAPDLKRTQPALSRLTKELSKLEPDLWHSFWCNCNDGSGNNIFSRNPSSWHRLSGLEYVREPLPVGDQGWLYFSPLVFRQGNMDGFDILANDVARHIPGGSKVCELYAGVGVLGLSALSYHAEQTGGKPLVWVRCSDENPSNQRCFSRSVESL